MAESWEAYSLNKNLDILNEHSFTAFRLQLIKDSDNVSIPLAADGAVVARPSLTKKRDPAENTVVITPTQKNKRQQQHGSKRNESSGNRRISLSPDPPFVTLNSSTPDLQLPAYSERQGSGKVVADFNPSKVVVTDTTTDTTIRSHKPKCVIANDFPTNVQEPYRHMFTVLDERAARLDEQLQEKYDEFCGVYDFGSEQIAGLEAVGVPRQEAVCCIGRICNSVSCCEESFTKLFVP